MTGYVGSSDVRRWPVAAAATPRTNWRGEAVILVLASAFSTMIGALMGLIWPRVAPHINAVNAYYRGSVAADKALLGDDVWFGFLGILAGIVCVAILLVSSGDLGRGPGAVLGVAIGGVLGSLVAGHVGTAVQAPHIVSSVRMQVPTVRQADITRILSYFTFKLRAREMFLAWPITAVVLVGLNVLVRYLRHPDSSGSS